MTEQIPSSMNQPKLIVAHRSPTDKDMIVEETIWIMIKRWPNNVWRGSMGKWKLVGHFYPKRGNK